MKGEDKIFLLEAYHALNGNERTRWRFQLDKGKNARLVQMSKTYSKEEFNEEVLKIKELCNEQI